MNNLYQLNDLLSQINNCKKCNNIIGYRKFPAHCHGNPKSRILLVSEGAYLPSIEAGRYFTRSPLRNALPDLEQRCYLTDVIKCHSNCSKTEEIANRCLPFLFEEIEIIQPKAILAVGSMPFRILTGIKGEFISFHGARGKFLYKGVEIIPVIHPSRANQYYPIEPKVENYKKSIREIIESLG